MGHETAVEIKAGWRGQSIYLQVGSSGGRLEQGPTLRFLAAPADQTHGDERRARGARTGQLEGAGTGWPGAARTNQTGPGPAREGSTPTVTPSRARANSAGASTVASVTVMPWPASARSVRPARGRLRVEPRRQRFVFPWINRRAGRTRTRTTARRSRWGRCRDARSDWGARQTPFRSQGSHVSSMNSGC